MQAGMRPMLSEKSKYWIDKHRYYELKHFCLQYPEWKKKCCDIKAVQSKPMDDLSFLYRDGYSDPTAKQAENLIMYGDKVKLVENMAMVADPGLYEYLVKGITEGLSYNNLKTLHNIPCSRNTYYDRYRRFFWLLDVQKN